MKRRARLGFALSAVVAFGLGGAAQATAQAPLLPDLQPLALEEGDTIGLYPDDGAMILDVGFKAANIGAGPLELEPLAAAAPSDPAFDCDGDGNPANDRPEQQNVYLDSDASGEFDPAVDTDVQSRIDGCSIYHPGHAHWHAAVMTTDLIPDGSDQPTRALDKLTFCLLDAGVYDSGLPGFDEDDVYPLGGCGAGSAQGVSVGWYDTYVVNLQGQQIDVSSVPAGGYCVRQAIDSSASIDELDETNNVVETRIALDPAADGLTVLDGECEGELPPVIDTTPPDTQLVNSPPPRMKIRGKHFSAQFGFTTEEARAQLSCSVDRRDYKPCSSPMNVNLRARRGRWSEHTFGVRATDVAKNADTSPAFWRGVIKRRR